MSPIVVSLAFVFWLAIISLLQTFVLYPVELLLWTFISPSEEGTTKKQPSVTLVIAAYNEEDVIEEKIKNSLKLTYSELDIVVFSDASDDRTDEIVRSFTDEGVELQRIEGRVGKTACQNRVVETLSTDFVVFSDANSMYDSDAIERLVKQFEDGVGCVVGELRYEGGNVEGESFYWRYEQLLKRLESAFHTLVTGNGAIYAVRAESYVPLPNDAISDFAEPLAIVRNGETVKYAPNAVAREYTGESVESELTRRVRIVTRSWHTFLTNRDLANPIRYPQFSFQVLSHKVLRWLAPILLVVAFVTNALLVVASSSPAYDWLLVGQVLFYALAIVGAVALKLGFDVPVVFHVPHYFVAANYGMFRGLLEFLRHGTVVTWETTDRTEG